MAMELATSPLSTPHIATAVRARRFNIKTNNSEVAAGWNASILLVSYDDDGQHAQINNII